MVRAIAITVHKAQGSEYDTVHIFLPEESVGLATRKLVYTAITRAKKRVVIYNIGKTYEKAMENEGNRERSTFLFKKYDDT